MKEVDQVVRAIHRFSDEEATPRIESQCEEEDLNLHSFRNQILSLARLPVPPSSRGLRGTLAGGRARVTADGGVAAPGGVRDQGNPPRPASMQSWRAWSAVSPLSV